MQRPTMALVPCAEMFLTNVTRHLFFCHSLFYDLSVSVEVPKYVTDFGAELPRAVINNDTLELVSGTFFLGNQEKGSKLFIRPCYKEISRLILNGVSSGEVRNLVVTGTPGIGISMFGFYLLYLLRCQGKTVVFDLKGDWYRFSDEGVAMGEFSSFKTAGHLNVDVDSWHLSDPEWHPYENFRGVTVVLVSPKRKRVNQFLKQKSKSQELFMPVWDMDELLECRQAVYPHVPPTDVRDDFGHVGGVARAVFNTDKLRQLMNQMAPAARDMDMVVLRQILSREHGNSEEMSTDKSRDELLHIFPLPDEGFQYFDVNFASDYARKLAERALLERDERALAAMIGAALANKKLGDKWGPSALGCGFEEAAHNAIGGAENGEGSDGRRFSMTILRNNGDCEVLEWKDWLKFNFTRRRTFTGSTLPDALESGIYYQPEANKFAAIDSVGVDGGGDTVFFFQMQSKAVTAVDGSTVEKYWNTVLASNSASSCVFVYVVPDRSCVEGKKPTKICKSPWLKGARDDFKAKCSVCVVEIGFVFVRDFIFDFRVDCSGVASPIAGTGKVEST